MSRLERLGLRRGIPERVRAALSLVFWSAISFLLAGACTAGCLLLYLVLRWLLGDAPEPS